MDNMAEFAKRLRLQREKHNLTQAQLAEKVGVSAQTISAYERNGSGEKGKTPTLDKVVSLAKILGVSIDYLCGTNPTSKDCSMESLQDIAECLTKIASYVRCYGGVKTRRLTDEEYEQENFGVPREYATETTKMAVFTMDNCILANFFETKNKLLDLYKSGTIEGDLYKTIIDGQLSKLHDYKIQEKTTWFPGGIDTDSDLQK